QHDNLAEIIKNEGGEIIYVNCDDKNLSKIVNVRDLLCVTPGGAIINRLAPSMRQGEELWAVRTLAEQGVPINGSIVGGGIFEGGSFGFLNSHTAIAGHSKRGNNQGIQQLKNILEHQGIDLITVPLVGHSLHTDSAFKMVDSDKAVFIQDRLPYWFLEKLEELGIKTIQVDQEERWAINCLPVRPGRVVVEKEASKALERMDKAGVELIPLDYTEVQKNGGGIHCTTNTLLRDSL